MRIFLGLREIAGYYNSLRLGFEEVGIEARFVNLYNHKFQYGEPDKQLLSRICRATGAYKNSTKIIPLKMFYFAVHYFFRIILFLKCLFKYDVFIFGYNSTFFYYLDLPVLKFFNKKIIYVFHGSDSRPPYIDGAYIKSKPKPSIDDCFNEKKKKKKILLIIEKYADHIINQLPQSYLHQRDFILKLAVGIPFESDIENISNTGSNKIFTILHSPSFPEAKGSETIETIIKELKKDGYKIELKKIQNMQNKIVIENILHCDLAIDQLYSDHPLAGFATEASYFGRAVIVGGYYLDYV
ncbi:MAG: hypothetical protein KDK36_09405, partial [Leptospiraceae bacterium]|nr:hypothetical protein [Leptospiraceae bacterium]